MNIKYALLFTLICFSIFNAKAQVSTEKDSVTAMLSGLIGVQKLNPVLVINGTLVRDTSKYEALYDFYHMNKGKMKSIIPSVEMRKELGIEDEYVGLMMMVLKDYIYDPNTSKFTKISKLK